MSIFQRIKLYFQYDIWHVSREKTPLLKYLIAKVFQVLVLAVKVFMAKKIMRSATSLTYSTLLAIVPVFAVIFAIARGFGYSRYIEEWFRDVLSSQPQVAETIIGFVNSYLIHAHGGVILGIGLLFMIGTVVMLTSNIEMSFNEIWMVKESRSMLRCFTDYTAIFFLLPIIIIIMSGVSIVAVTISDRLNQYFFMAPFIKFIFKVAPWVIMSVIFIVLYMFMPNTRVKFKNAVFPGILAGIAMQILQWFYIHSQIWVSSYNAIYGSFAALPLFMLWLQISWTICLFGAELCYINQNLEELTTFSNKQEISHRYRMLLSLSVLKLICKNFDGDKKPLTALQIKIDTQLPMRIVNQLLYDLEQAHIIVAIHDEHKKSDKRYIPAMGLDNITVGMVTDRLESLGKWNLNFSAKQLLTKEGWGSIYTERMKYLDRLREIKVTEL